MSTATTTATSVAAFTKGVESIARRRLVLHLDVNRTLIQTDPAGGKTLEDVMNANVAARVFGTVDAAARTWAAVPGSDPNQPAAPAAAAEGERVMPYDEFVDEVMFPKPAEMATLPPMEAKALWAEVSGKRRQAKHGFTHEGGPGAAFRANYEQLLAAMTDGVSGKPYYLIPSFFALLNTLSVADWPFSVVFRTFGTDLPPVLDEYFSFVRGEHPSFKPEGPRLAAAKRDLERNGADKWCPCAQLHRSEGGIFLTRGTSSLKMPEPDADVAAYYAEHGLTSIKVSEPELEAAIRADTEPAGEDSGGVPSLGLVDYYPWWAAHGEHGSAGKVFPLRGDGSQQYHVFFDDNIRFGHPEGRSIVNMQRLDGADAPASVEATSKALHDAFLCRVDPWDAILSTDYFAAEALARMQRQHALIVKDDSTA